ncbi:hypothetical protein BURKHO8Y_40077 [Burkholderia sp. 8Y]|nr:hypothetical protein BURKHO8Y_40077 [Burkholderia sp. 8Y]
MSKRWNVRASRYCNSLILQGSLCTLIKLIQPDIKPDRYRVLV